MATIAAAIANDVSDAGSGSLHPGRMQNTARVPAGNGPTGSGVKMPQEMDKYGLDTVRSLVPARVTDKKTRSKESVSQYATVPGAVIKTTF